MIVQRRTITYIALSLTMATINGACQQQLPKADSAWLRDSAAYEASLAQWRRDSVIRDSISHLVNTDSLYQLHRQMLVVKDPHELLQEQACEHYRLVHRYGVLPVDLAMARMEDTVWRGISDGDARRLSDVKGRFTEVRLSEERCGINTKPGPWTVNGTNLNAFSDRPRPPRR